MYDYFDAELRCPRCGTAHPSNEGNMQTHIRTDANGSELGIGYLFEPIDVNTEHLVGAGYLLLTRPTNEETLRLLNIWSCDACDTDQWAIVDIVERKIERIEAVSMSRTVLEAANFIGEVNAEFLAAQLLNISLQELNERKLDVVDALRERLGE